MPEQWKLAKTLENLEKFQKVKPYLCGTGKEERHLKPEVLAAYKVGAAIFRFRDDATQKPVDRECVTFPWLTYVHPDDRNKAKDQEATEVHHERVYNAKGEEEDEESTYVEEEPSKQEERPLIMLRMKYRPVEVKDFRLDPPGGQWGLFGWHLVENTDKEEIILTEGEFDAMSVYQGTGKPAVSLPNGASSLPVEIIEMLEPFKRIYLWMDDDVKGQEGAEKFAQKLGKGRCYIVRCSSVPGGKAVKDANDALRAKLDLKLMLKNAAPLPHKQILRFSELRDQIFTELRNPAQVAGTMCRTFPSLNLILKGHRPGELTIVTGHTGVGKTTILSQLSLDYAQQGINTLWGSFEVENVRLIKKMLTQFSGKNLAEHINDFPIFADKFEELPIYFLRFYGSTSIDEVIDAMQYAAYVLDVDHVILDNLQFMSGSTARGYEKFDNIDIAIEKIRKFATDRRVHVTLVIHPKKMDDGIPLTMASVFGTAKATQEADNVIIVQKSPQWRYLEICKNRFDGTLGQIPYKFQEESLRYYELTQMEKIQMERAAGVNNEPPQGNVQGNAPRYFQRGKRNFA
uniref:SF4 helicase domain-containing protein n=1 Tax=Arcella intermedia TaxID=1963864 RepID=A0A6B2L092_9EUKA